PAVRTAISKLSDALTTFAPQERSNDRALFDFTLDRLFPDNPVLGGNELELLCDGAAVYPRMLEDIRKAQHSIRLESFILAEDSVGSRILSALKERAEAGVEVQVLYDGVGSFPAYLRRLIFHRRSKIQMKAFSPLSLFAPWRVQLRNHRKLLVVDGVIAYSGGINISEENEHTSRVPARAYIHDLHCRICGPATAQFTMQFFRDWLFTTGRHIPVAEDFPLPKAAGKTNLRVIDSGPGENYEAARMLFLTASALAKETLVIITPYFVPGKGFIDALTLAAARGVEIKLIVPAHNNHWYVAYAARSFYRTLLEAGVRIYEKQSYFSHTKALLADGSWGFMGSSNCDCRSFHLNFELDFCFEGGSFPSTLTRQIFRELADSHEITLADVERKNPGKIFLEDLCSMLAPIL
ncbi:MAG: phospholipase D-like domain-containing protein, partial [Victivallaceae bacterium]|nr:phospholipase D-like domain-containing protein [Victivallaceae bacterium]